MDAPMSAIATRCLLATSVLAAALLPGPVAAADEPHVPAHGTFTSLEFNPASGDLSGYEIELLPAPHGMTVVLKIAEGELVDVAVAEAVLDQGEVTASFALSKGRVCALNAKPAGTTLVVEFDFGNGVRDNATLTRSVGYWDGAVASP
jgi:hypothetical protein